MSNSRKVMLLPITDTMFSDDTQILEDDNFVSAEVQTLKERIQKDPIFSDLSQSYGIDKKKDTVTTRGELFLTVKNLIEASYGGVHEDYEIYLGVFDNSTDRVNFGYCSIGESSAILIALFFNEDETFSYFEENDTTPFSGFIISPYGEIIGTENWSEA